MPLSHEPAGATAVDFADLRELVEEPAGGHNHGRVATTDPDVLGRTLPHGVKDVQERALLQGGGFTFVFPSNGGAGTFGDAGMTSHRGVLHSDEYVDADALRSAVEDALGFTYDDVRAVYRRGRLTPAQAELRARIDARLLELARGGANMDLLARLLGFKAPKGTWPTALKNAVRRARAAEVTS